MSQKRIWKYNIPITDHFEIEMPKNSHILCVQTQHGRPQIWVLVDSLDAPREKRTFSVVGTGKPADHVRHEPEFYIGTFQILNRNKVWHLFELPVIKLSDIVK